MRAGERAAVYITDPAYGYGDKGSFSFPSVPPSCQLVYEVDMIAWEPPAEVRDLQGLSADECSMNGISVTATVACCESLLRLVQMWL
jgi:hypothetical protein